MVSSSNIVTPNSFDDADRLLEELLNNEDDEEKMLDLIINGSDRNSTSLTDALIASPSFSNNNAADTDLQLDVDDLELEDRRSRLSYSATRQYGSQSARDEVSQIKDDLNDLLGDDTPVVRKTTTTSSTTTTTFSSPIKTSPPKQKQGGTSEALSRSSNVGEMIKRRYEEKRAIDTDTDDDNTELDDDSLYLSGDDDDDDSEAPLVNGESKKEQSSSASVSSGVQIKKPAKKANDGWFSYKGWQENKPVLGEHTSPKKRSKTPTLKSKPTTTTTTTAPAPAPRKHNLPRRSSHRPGGPGGSKNKSHATSPETSPPVRCGKKEILISLMTLYMVVSLYTNASRLFGRISSKAHQSKHHKKKQHHEQQPNHENYQDQSWNNEQPPDMMMSPQHQQLQPPMRDMYPMIHHQGNGNMEMMPPPPHHHQQHPQHPGFQGDMQNGMPHPPDQFIPPVGNAPLGPQEFYGPEQQPPPLQDQMPPPVPDQEQPQEEEEMMEAVDVGELVAEVEEEDEEEEEEPVAAEEEDKDENEEEPAVEEEKDKPAVEDEEPVGDEEVPVFEAEEPDVKEVEAGPVPESETETEPETKPEKQPVKEEKPKDEPKVEELLQPETEDEPSPSQKEQQKQQKPPPKKEPKDENPVLAVLTDVDDLFNDETKDAMPFFWSVPPNEAGTLAVKDIMDRCFDLTRAEVVSNEGNHIVEYVSSKISGAKAQKRRLLLEAESDHIDEEMQQHSNEQQQLYNLKMKNKMIRRRRLEEQSNDNNNDSQIEQLQLQHQHQHQRRRNLKKDENKKDEKSSQVEEDLLVASNLYILKKIFNPTHPNPHHREAKMFTFFLHPNHRFAYMFEYLKKAKFEPTYDGRIQSMTLMDYAKHLEKNPNDPNLVRVSNWMTRSLTHSAPKAELSESDVELATIILKEKSLVLLYDMMEESLRRLKTVFSWGGDNASVDCVAKAVERPVINEKIVEKNKEVWKYISRFNELDIQLYKNARVIFQEQGIEFFGNKLSDLVS